MEFAPVSPNAVPYDKHRMGCGLPMEGCPLCGGAGYWRDGFGMTPCPCAATWTLSKVTGDAIKRIAQKGKPCDLCGNRGGTRVNGKWIRCQCTKTTAAERKLMRQMNQIGARNPARQQTLF